MGDRSEKLSRIKRLKDGNYSHSGGFKTHGRWNEKTYFITNWNSSEEQRERMGKRQL